MTLRFAPFLLCVSFAVLGIWSLAEGDYTTGTLQLEFSAFWLLMAIWGTNRNPGLFAKHAPRDTPRQTTVPRWMLIAYVVVALTFIAFGVTSLGKGNSTSGGFQIALGTGLLLLTAFKIRRPASEHGPD